MLDRKSKSKTIILIADDDLDILELLKFTFESEGYSVLAVSDGEEAVKKTKQEHPDIVILDVNMPKLSGFEVLEKIRQDATTRLVPIIMLTSLAKTKDKLTGIKLGADEYLNKPFEPVELLIRVEGLLRRMKETLYANPLTGLPGNVSVENEIKERLESGEPFAVMYSDVNNFKSFNDKYGFERGDKMIRAVSEILNSAVADFGSQNDFLGNIGAEDFIIITTHDKVSALAQNIIKNFDERIPQEYDQEVRTRGYVWGVDRQGRETKFSIMTISIGAAIVEKGKYHHYSQIVDKARELLNKAKSTQKSSFEAG